MHAQNSTNHIAVFRSRDRNWPIRALEFRILPDYRNFRFLTASWITWPKYGNLIGGIFPVFLKKNFLSISLSLFFSFLILFAFHVWPSMLVFIFVWYFCSPSLCFVCLLHYASLSFLHAGFTCHVWLLFLSTILPFCQSSFQPLPTVPIRPPPSNLGDAEISRRVSLLMSCANWTTLTIPYVWSVSLRMLTTLPQVPTWHFY